YIKQTEGAGSGIALAEIRLKEIAAAVGGRIIYSNFLPDPTAGISARGAPENLLPKVTARSFAEIMQELKNTQQLANYTITINTVEQYNALMAVKNNIGQNWSAQQWNAYLQDIPSAASATIDTSA
ncbi:MAG: hypothetical protein LBV49_08660, partial [Azonexus sp.]|nr:hypothetical protein [Azonexus sp.]